ncbi:MAG: GHKL domain-containing protein [Balneolaceae bacterium]|nr:GHKL domain-containing protein [Balneolaceae bacterium]
MQQIQITISLIFFILLAGIRPGWCQNEEYRFDHLTLRDGLSQSTIFAITQDSKGFMWFGTADGLNRYSGQSIKIFRNHPDDANSLSENYIHDLLISADGKLWIGHPDGVSIYEPHKQKFTNYSDESAHQIIHGTEAYEFENDAHGNIWMITDEGIVQYQQRQEKFVLQIKHSNRVFTTFYIDDTDHTFWLGTNRGELFTLDPSTKKLTLVTQLDSNVESSEYQIGVIKRDIDGSLWVGTSMGLYHYYIDKDHLQHFASDKEKNKISYNDVTDILVTSKGEVWVGTESGLNVYNREENTFKVLKHNPSIPYSLIGSRITKLFESKDGNIWVGNWTGGINLYSRHFKAFDHYRNEEGGSNELSENNVWDFWEDSTGDIWIGTNLGVNHFNPITKNFTHYLHRPGQPQSISSNLVFRMDGDERGNLWLATSKGLNRFNIESQTATHFQHNPNDPNSVSSNRIYGLYADKKSGKIWIGTAGEGLDIYDPQTDTFEHHYPSSQSQDSLTTGSIYVIKKDEQGYFWIGTSNGLNRYNPRTKTFKRFLFDPADSLSISSNSINSLLVDSHGRIWVGTSYGLNRYQPDTGGFVHYTVEDGLPNNTVYSIEEGKDGELFIGTRNGLSWFNLDQEKFRNFTVSDGLQSNEFNLEASLKSSTGKIYFGGIKGFNVFHSNGLNINTNDPDIVLTDFKVFNKSIEPNADRDDPTGKLKTSISYTDSLILNYEQNVFSFEFAALNYVLPEKNRYAYMMENFEENWNYVGSRNFATYTNLPPGEYTFRVKAANNDGVWNEEGLSLALTITPPFWQTSWFYLISFLFLAGMVVGGYQWRVRSIRKLNQRLERLVRERTEELRETLKELKSTRNELVEKAHKAGMADIATGVLHNVGNILNSLNTSANLMYETLGKTKLQSFYKANKLLRENRPTFKSFFVEDPRGEKLLDYYLKLEESLKKEQDALTKQNKRLLRKVDLINDVISAQQSYASSGAMNETLSLQEVIKDTLTLQAGSVERHSININKELEPTGQVTGDKSKLVHILVNLLKNAKEALEGNKPDNRNITIRLRQDEDTIYMSVCDNGGGIEQKVLNKIFSHGYTTKSGGHGFGLHSCANYMTEMGGKLTVNSPGLGKGATFTLMFPRADKVTEQAEVGKINGKPKV